MTTTRTPSLETVISSAIRSASASIRVALPARVESYDATTQQVTAQPLVLDGYVAEDGTRATSRLPVVTGVPVLFPGAGGFRVTFPIAVGDTVLLVFSSSSIDQWLALGGEVDPGDDRRHDLSDAIAIPGLHDFAHALTSAPTTTMSIGKDGGPTIEIGTTIAAGGSSALALRADVDALQSWALSHLHGGVTTGAGISAVPTVAPPTAAGTTILKGG